MGVSGSSACMIYGVDYMTYECKQCAVVGSQRNNANEQARWGIRLDNKQHTARWIFSVVALGKPKFPSFPYFDRENGKQGSRGVE